MNSAANLLSDCCICCRYRDAEDKLKRQTLAHESLKKANTIADLESATSSTSGMTLAGKLGTEYYEADERLRVRRRSVEQMEDSHRRSIMCAT